MKRKLVIGAIALAAVFILIAASLVIRSGGKDVSDVEEEAHLAQWTSLLWFCGDGNLGEWNMMLCNLHFLEMVPDSEESNILVILDKEGTGDTRLLEVHEGGSIELNLTDIDPEWTDNELNTGGDEELLKFLKWGADTYPAYRYNVHLSNHGGGWRGMCWDESEVDHLSLPEIGSVCDEFKAHIGRNIDILSTEGCLVGMAEFAYELVSSCDYFVGGSTYGWGSEADPENDIWEPGNWQYDKCWTNLSRNPEMDGGEFAIVMGKTFADYGPWRAPPFIPKESYSDVFAIYDLSRMEELTAAVDVLSKELLGKVTGIGQTINQATLINLVIGHPETPDELHTESFSGQMDWIGLSTYTNYDLWDLAYMLTKSTAGTMRSTTNAKRVMELVDETIILLRNTDESGGHADAHGISIYLPYRSSEYNSDYEDIRFAQDTGWDEFIKAVQWT